ncbi:MAG TPA: nucleotidyltransferase family protein [Candidatus Acidoferrum sp.]|nr:nucleotidyltransferase family protein [Candidatus Acidoferrum sp.]
MPDGTNGDRLRALIHRSAWFMGVLEAARDCDPPDWWIGAGVIRYLVWGHLHAGFDHLKVRDVDLAFFDPMDLSPERDLEVEAALRRRLPDVPWEAKNQAAVHTWYERRFGFAVEPLTSMADAVATWPETATSVAVRLGGRGDLQITAPYGLDDLLDGVCRRNPRRISVDAYRRRLDAKQVATRWPHVVIVR